MEIRIWIPNNIGGWRYCFKNPKSFIIGVYGYRRYKKMLYSAMLWSSKYYREQRAHETTRNKLVAVRKELTQLKRGG